ncbi:capsule biosynthesis protein [Komagataeibacter sp. FNDCR2]|uniref:capsule biosynthesis protein n=1 Tax=Komagataeibacter sp. FNDCR2 TaxID=2878682 RepID=UPI001E2AC65E|nr:capsular biosynthesis protein [Komagataeibacter sp. FNDCR2]MCE2575916.1 capsular biosynthesis protein [Komagataeibacter sp. FNDCR2]
MHDPRTRPQPATRRFLLLQGLMGPFFRRVGKGLRKAGYEVYKINFNGGDQLFWRLPNGIDYTGDGEHWPAFLADVIERHDITDVMLFGDCRPMHRAAIALCGHRHIPVHVFEEGYIRPDWVTLEIGGVNGHSTLPRDPEWYREEAARLPPVPEHRPVPSSFRRRALEAVAYNAADILSRWYFCKWKDYRPWHPWAEGIGWLKRLRNRKTAESRTQAVMETIADSARPYMIFPLQLDADAQVRLHSNFAGMEPAIRHVIRSFAGHAPAGTVLLIKEHPLDNGLRDWRGLVGDIAREYGVDQRVYYIETGDIALLVQKARGVVTINSTTGTLALASGIPVLALGEAVYNIPQITDQVDLDTFWVNPTPPDRATYDAFRRVLIDRCLIAGGFFSEEGQNQLVAGVLRRLSKITVPERIIPVAKAPDRGQALPTVRVPTKPASYIVQSSVVTHDKV